MTMQELFRFEGNQELKVTGGHLLELENLICYLTMRDSTVRC